MRFRQTLVLAVVLTALAAPAAHASPSAVIRDCADDGQLEHHYSNRDLKGALNSLPADLNEYSDCHEVISAAITAGGGGGHRRSGGGPGAAAAAKAASSPTTGDVAALARATHGGKPRLRVGGTTVVPGSNGLFHLASAENGIPGPLLAALIALALLALAAGGLVLRRRVPALSDGRAPALPPFLRRVPRPRFRRR